MVRPVKIGNLSVGGYFDKPVFVAELGINVSSPLDGGFELADRCIDSGADIIKFQMHGTSEMLPDHVWFQLMRNHAMSLSCLRDMKCYIENAGKTFLCTPFSSQAANTLEDMNVCAFKIGSGECNNIPFLKHVALKGKPMIISTGMTMREELIASLDAVRKINKDIILLNCTSNYPSTPEQTRLRRIDWLKSMFGLPTGHSDHSPSISTALGAIARGACLIEKHVTLDKNANGPDHKVSLLPSEFKQMVDTGTEIWEGLKMCTETDMTTLVEGEQELRDIANHSIVTINPIQRGDQFTMGNIWVKRPGTGIPASMFEEMLGRFATEDLEEGHLVWYDEIA